MRATKVFKIIEENIEEALQFLIKAAKQELKDQGHSLTGNLEKSFEVKLSKALQGGLTGEIVQEQYAEALDKGIKARRVPFRRGRRGSGGGSSRYIQALIRFFQLRGINARDAKRFAFATANKAKKTGHPTKPYYQGRSYSSNGRRTGWVKNSYTNANVRQMEKIINLGQAVNEIVNEVIRDITVAA
jgi:hypothetical protein